MKMPSKDEIIKQREKNNLPVSVPQTLIDLINTMKFSNYSEVELAEEYIKWTKQITDWLEELRKKIIPQIKVNSCVRKKKLAILIKEQLEEKGYNVKLKKRFEWDMRGEKWLDGYDFIITI